MYAGFAFVVGGGVQLERAPAGARIFRSRPTAALAGVGFFGYGIYLWHIDLAHTPLREFAAFLAAGAMPPELIWLATMLVYVAVAAGTGVAMSRLIELPALALRERHFGGKAPQPTPRPVAVPAPAVVTS